MYKFCLASSVWGLVRLMLPLCSPHLVHMIFVGPMQQTSIPDFAHLCTSFAERVEQLDLILHVEEHIARWRNVRRRKAMNLFRCVESDTLSFSMMLD